MSDEREDAAPRRRAGSSGGWKDAAVSAFLIGAVVVILLAGFLLKTDRATEARTAPAPPPPESPVLGAAIVPEARPEPEPPAPEPAVLAAPAPAPPPSPEPMRPSLADPLFERLATRAANDLSRLGQMNDPWTAQLLVACRGETVDRMLDRAAGATRLYVLPAEVKGEACFRVVWGTYKSQKEAAAAADLPAALRGNDKPGAVEVAKVIR
jgi:hypothetical protein